MKKIYLAFFIILSLSTLSYATLREPIEYRADLIIIGKLQDVSETETETTRVSEGTLVIEKIIYGKFRNATGQTLKSGDQVQVEWTNSRKSAYQFGFSENERKIWFLCVDNEGQIESLYSDTTTSLSDLARVKKYLTLRKDSKIVRIITARNNFEETKPTASVNKTSNPTVRCMYSVKAKQPNYSFLAAFSVILASISLYYFLYRSKYKIR